MIVRVIVLKPSALEGRTLSIKKFYKFINFHGVLVKNVIQFYEDNGTKPQIPRLTKNSVVVY